MEGSLGIMEPASRCGFAKLFAVLCSSLLSMPDTGEVHCNNILPQANGLYHIDANHGCLVLKVNPIRLLFIDIGKDWELSAECRSYFPARHELLKCRKSSTHKGNVMAGKRISIICPNKAR